MRTGVRFASLFFRPRYDLCPAGGVGGQHDRRPERPSRRMVQLQAASIQAVENHGVLAPSARDRSKIVPTAAAKQPESHKPSTSPQQRAHRLAWATLLARVFAIDVTECQECGGAMCIIAALSDPASIRGYLEGVGLPARPPPIAPRRRSPQTELEFAACHSSCAGWFYSTLDALGFLYTGSSLYPFLYSTAQSAWLYHRPGTPFLVNMKSGRPILLP